MSLIDKLRKSRQINVESKGKLFIVRRPTDLEMIDLQNSGGLTQGDIIKRFVCGWEGIKELDIIPGGTGEMVKFDSELFGEWIQDQPEHWSPITESIVTSYKKHKQKLEDELGESTGG